jgi:hypothetical protein
MKQVADDVFLLPAFPPNAINVYVAGGFLIDAGTRTCCEPGPGRRVQPWLGAAALGE